MPPSIKRPLACWALSAAVFLVVALLTFEVSGFEAFDTNLLAALSNAGNSAVDDAAGVVRGTASPLAFLVLLAGACAIALSRRRASIAFW